MVLSYLLWISVVELQFNWEFSGYNPKSLGCGMSVNFYNNYSCFPFLACVFKPKQDNFQNLQSITQNIPKLQDHLDTHFSLLEPLVIHFEHGHDEPRRCQHDLGVILHIPSLHAFILIIIFHDYSSVAYPIPYIYFEPHFTILTHLIQLSCHPLHIPPSIFSLTLKPNIPSIPTTPNHLLSN